jgi:hypothetical protein
VLTPDEAKGLEFDVVVVVEPAAIVAESEHGLRALFVALTRCTNRLALVHVRPLPAILGLAPQDAASGDDTTAAPVSDLVDTAAEVVVPSDDDTPVGIDETDDDATGGGDEGEPGLAPVAGTPGGAPAHGLADRVVVSTPGPEVAAALDALGDLDHDIARAIATTVVDKLASVVAASLLPLIAEELARALATRIGRQDLGESDAVVTDAQPTNGVPTP